MHNQCRISHVLFDLDGLLIDSETIYTKQLSVFLAKHDKVFTYEAKRLMMGRKPIEAAAALQRKYDLQMTPEMVLQEYREELPLEIWHTASLLPGVSNLIGHLKDHSILMAIATGSVSFQVEHKMWNSKDILRHIHHIVAAGDDPEVLHGKPAPDVFKVALQRFEDPMATPETTLVFEDAWNGVLAGLAAGMRVVWVPESSEAPGIPEGNNLSDELKSRIFRLSSLEEFDPTIFGIPAYSQST